MGDASLTGSRIQFGAKIHSYPGRRSSWDEVPDGRSIGETTIPRDLLGTVSVRCLEDPLSGLSIIYIVSPPSFAGKVSLIPHLGC